MTNIFKVIQKRKKKQQGYSSLIDKQEINHIK